MIRSQMRELTISADKRIKQKLHLGEFGCEFCVKKTNNFSNFLKPKLNQTRSRTRRRTTKRKYKKKKTKKTKRRENNNWGIGQQNGKSMLDGMYAGLKSVSPFYCRSLGHSS